MFWHAFLFFGILIIWIIVRLLIGISLVKGNGKYYKAILVITLFTSTGFTAIIWYAFKTRHIAGYQVTDEWAWLKTLYYYEPIYKGEWSALLYLYLSPLCLGLVIALLFFYNSAERFLKYLLSLYPVILLVSYVTLYLSLSTEQLNTSRERMFIERSS